MYYAEVEINNIANSHIKRYISLSSMHKPTSKTSVTCHCSMNGTLTKKCAVHVVRSIAGNSSNHIGRICQLGKERVILDISVILSFNTQIFVLISFLPTYIFESYAHCLLFSKMILQHRRFKMVIITGVEKAFINILRLQNICKHVKFQSVLKK